MRKLHFPGQYCIDTSALIHMSIVYPRDVFPSPWEDLEMLKRNARLVAPPQVLEELRPKNDALLEWAKANRDMFEATEEEIRLAADIVHKFSRLVDTERETEQADPFVIALAITNGCSVVTEEKGESERKIPGVCAHYQVECLSLLEFFREQDWVY